MGETCGNHRRHADHGTGGKIDAAGNDHLCHANGDNADDRDLQDDDAQTLRVHQEALTGEDPAEYLEDQRNADQHQKNIDFGRQPRLRRETAVTVACSLVIVNSSPE